MSDEHYDRATVHWTGVDGATVVLRGPVTLRGVTKAPPPTRVGLRILAEPLASMTDEQLAALAGRVASCELFTVPLTGVVASARRMDDDLGGVWVEIDSR